MSREYPSHPRVGVGAVILDAGRVLFVRRGHQPGAGTWSLPGGVVELGETLEDALRREIVEECGLDIRPAGVTGVIDRIVRDDDGRIQYHWVIIDYLAFPAHADVVAGSDAAEAQWVPVDRVDTFETTDAVREMIRKAIALAAEQR